MTKKKDQKRVGPAPPVELDEKHLHEVLPLEHEAVIRTVAKFLDLDRNKKWRELTRGTPIGMSAACGSLPADKKQVLLLVKRLLDEEARAAHGSHSSDDQKKTLQHGELMSPAPGAIVDNRLLELILLESLLDDQSEAPHKKWWKKIPPVAKLIAAFVAFFGSISSIASFVDQVTSQPASVAPSSQEQSESSTRLNVLAPQGSLQQDTTDHTTWFVKIDGTSQKYILHPGSYIVIQIDGKNIVGRITEGNHNQYVFVDENGSGLSIKLSLLQGQKIRVIVKRN